MIERFGGVFVIVRAMVICLVFVLALSVAACDDAGAELTIEGVDTDIIDGAAPPPAPSDLLSPADVESVSGLSGLRTVPFAPESGAGGDVNIATADGQLVVMLTMADAEAWDGWMTDGTTVAEPVTPPVGDEAFIGPAPDAGGATYILGFRRGETAVQVVTFPEGAGPDTVLSVEHLRALAEVIESRL